MNNYQCRGRIVRDLTIKKGRNDISVLSFSLAVQSGYGDNKTTTYPSFTAFGKSADAIAKYCGKGDELIIVRSRYSTNEYTDRDGNKRTSISFLVDEFEFGAKKGGNSNNANNSNPASTSTATGSDNFMDIPPGIDEDMPFN